MRTDPTSTGMLLIIIWVPPFVDLTASLADDLIPIAAVVCCYSANVAPILLQALNFIDTYTLLQARGLRL
ncbi:hypothetical protein V1527DRAFT_471065, partial [Lipomyces starkeyi]